jgi:tetratricopeptide (TPR) repeat protein
MKKIGTSFLILLFIFMCSGFCMATSELRQKRLIQLYFAAPQEDWSKVTSSNKDLLNDNLLKMLEEDFRGYIKFATDVADRKNERRAIPDVTYAYANLYDYLAGQIKRPAIMRVELAKEYLKDGYYPVAVEICNIVMMSEPRNIDVALIKAELFSKMGMMREAMDVYLNIEKIDKNNEIALYRLGVLNVHLANYDKAVEYFRRYLRIRPDSHEAKAFIDMYDGRAAADSKDINRTAIHHFMNAERFYQGGNYREAAEFYSMAIENDPHFYKAYAHLGECLTRLNKYDESRQVLEHAISVSPNQPEAYHFLGLAFEKEYNFNRKIELLQKAVENYEKALKAAPSYKPAQEDLERARRRMKEK